MQRFIASVRLLVVAFVVFGLSAAAAFGAGAQTDETPTAEDGTVVATADAGEDEGDETPAADADDDATAEADTGTGGVTAAPATGTGTAAQRHDAGSELLLIGGALAVLLAAYGWRRRVA